MEDLFLLSIRTHMIFGKWKHGTFAVKSLEDNVKVPMLNISHDLFYIINCTSFLRGHKQSVSGTTEVLHNEAEICEYLRS